MRRVGIFGGTFDPPHLGHSRAAAFFANALALERVWILPAGLPPMKEAPQTAAAERLQLCRLAFAGDARFEVRDGELRRAGVSYTVDTVREVRAAVRDAELYLLVGTDQLRNFTCWKDWWEILEMCRLCALPRGAATPAVPPALPRDRLCLLTGFAPLATSASEIRRKLAAGEDAAALLAAPVYEYIVKKGLYGANPNA
ncbi:MAG: nicotinate (nicotinamide) nucleotide adenylyltransferase [Oscillospiraceae bacterium]|nr:nicotinate (nicotinamide) nucleotide adenylyltransferase [Oscillospiraceae bacterium]